MALFYAILFGIAVFSISIHYMERFFDWLRFQSLGTRDYIVEKLELMHFKDITASKVLVWLILASVLPFTIMFLVFLPKVIPGIFFGLVGAILGWKLPKPIVNYMYQKRIEKFNEQMVDGLGLVANSLKAGLSISQALQIVIEQMPAPISEEFAEVINENQLGATIEDAFIKMAKRVPCEDVDMFVTTVNILKETGGNMIEPLETIVYVIRERVKVENKIKSMTAQGFYQGMMLMSIPPLLGIYFGLTEPGFMDPMLEKPIGWVIIAAVIFLEVIAYYVITKVVKIDI